MIILFGSYARGDFSANSDLDLIVLSDDWGGKNYTKRLSLLYKIWDKHIDANFIPLTQKELEERLNRSIVLRDASKYWNHSIREKGVDLRQQQNKSLLL